MKKLLILFLAAVCVFSCERVGQPKMYEKSDITVNFSNYLPSSREEALLSQPGLYSQDIFWHANFIGGAAQSFFYCYTTTDFQDLNGNGVLAEPILVDCNGNWMEDAEYDSTDNWVNTSSASIYFFGGDEGFINEFHLVCRVDNNGEWLKSDVITGYVSVINFKDEIVNVPASEMDEMSVTQSIRFPVGYQYDTEVPFYMPQPRVIQYKTYPGGDWGSALTSEFEIASDNQGGVFNCILHDLPVGESQRIYYRVLDDGGLWTDAQMSNHLFNIRNVYAPYWVDPDVPREAQVTYNGVILRQIEREGFTEPVRADFHHAVNEIQFSFRARACYYDVDDDTGAEQRREYLSELTHYTVSVVNESGSEYNISMPGSLPEGWEDHIEFLDFSLGEACEIKLFNLEPGISTVNVRAFDLNGTYTDFGFTIELRQPPMQREFLVINGTRNNAASSEAREFYDTIVNELITERSLETAFYDCYPEAGSDPIWPSVYDIENFRHIFYYDGEADNNFENINHLLHPFVEWGGKIIVCGRKTMIYLLDFSPNGGKSYTYNDPELSLFGVIECFKDTPIMDFIGATGVNEFVGLDLTRLEKKCSVPFFTIPNGNTFNTMNSNDICAIYKGLDETGQNGGDSFGKPIAIKTRNLSGDETGFFIGFDLYYCAKDEAKAFLGKALDLFF